MPPRPDITTARAAVARAEEIGIAAAARELDKSPTTISHWKARLPKWEREYAHASKDMSVAHKSAGAAGEAVSGMPACPVLTDKAETRKETSERERMLAAEVKRLKSELARKSRGEDRLVLEVKEALESLDVRPFNLPSTIPGPFTTREREHLILMFSDTQIGKSTPGYDLATAEERTMQVAERFLRVADVRSNHAEIAGVTIYWGGDAVEGEQIYASQAWHVECGVGPQSTKYGPEIHAKMALTLAQHCPRPIRVRSVPGNHGRIGAINMPSSPTTNWDRVCYESAELMLSAWAPGAFDIRHAEDWYLVDRLPGGWGALLTHGDMIGGGGSSASIIRAANGWAEALPEAWDYMMIGHFHKPWHLQTSGGTRDVYVNGSIETDDSDFVRGRMKAGGRPCQRMFVLTEERGIIEAPILYPTRRTPMGRGRYDA